MRLLLPILVLTMCALPVFAQVPEITTGVSHDLALWRAAHYSDVRYKLNLTLEKMSPVLKGTIEIRVKVSSPRPADAMQAGSLRSDDMPPIILDWRKIAGHEKDSTVTNVEINAQKVRVMPSGVTNSSEITPKGVTHTVDDLNEHLIFRDGVVAGENVIKLEFTSPILTSGSAITRYIDKEDGSEYLYSLFVPSDASTAFPVFDQPDLKARFQLSLTVPSFWKTISNTAIPRTEATFKRWAVQDIIGMKTIEGVVTDVFPETKPISTYVFAFAAGPWQEFSDAGTTGGNATVTERAPSKPAQVSSSADNPSAQVEGTLPNGRVSARADTTLSTYIYVRKSQAAKFQPHAAEVFKMTREGVKYLEDYFDFKFPWPKYDLVLIPEFPFGGMEHAGATFLSERGVIFPSEPTANDYISRANLIFHETAHQWFGDTVTMRWFDDLWLKEGFAEFMAYKTLEHVMPQYNAWKAFYERNKQAAYLTDSTKGTTPIYQPIENLSAAKSAYGNIVYRKAPSFLRQAEFYLGPDKFQTAVRAFLKKHAFANATWQDLVGEFEGATGLQLQTWGEQWVTQPGVNVFKVQFTKGKEGCPSYQMHQRPAWTGASVVTEMRIRWLARSTEDGTEDENAFDLRTLSSGISTCKSDGGKPDDFIFPNYGDYAYGIFLLDDKSREYVLKNIQNEKDDFLRSMMWGSLWDSVREAELDPREYVELAIKNLPSEKDETITASALGRVSTAMTYYMSVAGVAAVSVPPAVAGGAVPTQKKAPPTTVGGTDSATDRSDLQARLEATLIDRMRTAPTLGQRITYYRAFLNIVSTENGRSVLKEMLKGVFGRTGGNATVTERAPNKPSATSRSGEARSLTVASLPVSATIPLKTKDRFDIVTRLAILGDPDAPTLLADLEKTETSDDAKRYAYAAHAAFATKENREKFWNDFVNNKDISESWIEAAMGPFNSPKHSDLSLPYLQRALAELPNQKRNRKIFFVNGWLGAFIGGQKSQEALDVVNKFLADNPNLDRDLRLKILENVDTIERAVKIRNKYGKS